MYTKIILKGIVVYNKTSIVKAKISSNTTLCFCIIHVETQHVLATVLTCRVSFIELTENNQEKNLTFYVKQFFLSSL